VRTCKHAVCPRTHQHASLEARAQLPDGEPPPGDVGRVVLEAPRPVPSCAVALPLPLRPAFEPLLEAAQLVRDHLDADWGKDRHSEPL
jgi:hypothetical protein